MTKTINKSTPKQTDHSPFHIGEQTIQKRLGVRQSMEAFGRRVIRDHLPEQHREFYNTLSFILLGHCDTQGWPWASIITGSPGFITSKDNTHLTINSSPIDGDPLASAITEGTKIGGLGIEPASRRRNRLSATIQHKDSCGFELKVQQTFGNCPQYIQARQFEPREQPLKNQTLKVIALENLDDSAKKLIASSDTFYVASSTPTEATKPHDTIAAHNGADVSHRGGQPGFIDIINDNTLIIPDYLGNNHYNTLGNFSVNPKAGLLFMDDKTGDILTLTGSVEIIWDHPLLKYFEGAQRFWAFKLDHGFWLKEGLPFKMQMQSYSPNTFLTGTWSQARALQQAEETRDKWHAFRLVKKKQESIAVTSFYLEPENGVLPKFEAGQFLSIQVIINGKPMVRPYTVSSAPGQKYYRISVKREQATLGSSNLAPGVVSNFLHDTIKIGDSVLVKSPKGKFTFNTKSTRPAVMLAAGIGITPIISMLKHALLEHVRTRSIRPIIVFASARSGSERSFVEELKNIANNSGGHIQVIWTLSQPEQNLIKGNLTNNQDQNSDYQFEGRLNTQILQSVLPLADYDFYLCGPDGFMQTTYDNLLFLGVSDAKINAEAFGPSSLQRQTKTIANKPPPPTKEVAPQAIVSIQNQRGEQVIEQQWQPKDGPLLDFAENHGLAPSYGCRNGNCGACSVKIISGEVTYPSPPECAVKQGDALLCCAHPAHSATNPLPSLALKI